MANNNQKAPLKKYERRLYLFRYDRSTRHVNPVISWIFSLTNNRQFMRMPAILNHCILRSCEGTYGALNRVDDSVIFYVLNNTSLKK